MGEKLDRAFSATLEGRSVALQVLDNGASEALESGKRRCREPPWKRARYCEESAGEAYCAGGASSHTAFVPPTHDDKEDRKRVMDVVETYCTEVDLPVWATFDFRPRAWVLF